MLQINCSSSSPPSSLPNRHSSFSCRFCVSVTVGSDTKFKKKKLVDPVLKSPSLLFTFRNILDGIGVFVFAWMFVRVFFTDKVQITLGKMCSKRTVSMVAITTALNWLDGRCAVKEQSGLKSPRPAGRGLLAKGPTTRSAPGPFGEGVVSGHQGGCWHGR